MNNVNIPKQICWNILQCCIFWYEGAEPTQYGYDKECSRIGKKLADNLFIRVEGLIEDYRRNGVLTGGKDTELRWVESGRSMTNG